MTPYSKHRVGCRSHPQSPGFTLVELLVVIAIIGTLIGLILPAVQSTRESCRRSKCGINLRQLQLAVLGYESTKRRLPAGYVSDEGRMPADPVTRDRPPGTGWGMLIAVHLEEAGLADDYVAGVGSGIGAPANQPVVTRPVAIFRCPSDGGPATAFEVQTVAGGRHPSNALLARSSYVANCGRDEPWKDAVDDWKATADGPLYRNSWLRLGQITDGLSKTVFLGEHSQRVSQKAWAGTIPGASSQPNEAFMRMAGSGADEAATLLLVHSGPAPGEDLVIHPPNDPIAHVCQMYSDHLGGCNVAMGDGSVRFVSETINHDVWAAVSSIDGGEAGAIDDQ